MRRILTVAAVCAVVAAAVATGFAQAAPEDTEGVTPMVSSSLVVNEVATRGPNGERDEFIEIRNLSTRPISLAEDFEIRIYQANGQYQTVSFPEGITLEARGQQGDLLLLAGENFSGTAPGWVTQVPLDPKTVDIPDNGGVAIFTATGAKVDGVAFSSAIPTTAAREGQPARPMTNLNVDPLMYVSSARDVLSTDTDQNRVDFDLHVATPGELN
ncbi:MULTISPECIES: lamin tail domain-containing protein [unclassified Saccharothrix]|uniref:lamin tail domain-containing protein n=1 Tax=unclassified Saccharothrix TaxID=2593673 RepID=UPI00307E1004